MFQPGTTTQATALGRTWTIGRLELGVIDAVREYIRKQIGDPYEKLKKIAALLPPEEVIRRTKEIDTLVDELEAFTMASELAQRFLSTEGGAAFLFCELMRPHHAEMTPALAFQIMLEIGKDKQAEALANAKGQVEPVGNAAAPAPVT